MEKIVKPVVPQDLPKKQKPAPEAVIRLFNRLLRKEFDGHVAIIRNSTRVQMVMSDNHVSLIDLQKIYSAWVVKHTYYRIGRDYKDFFAFYVK